MGSVKVALVTHDAGLMHDAGYRHPERPARMEAARDGVWQSGLEVVSLEAPPAGLDALHAVHEAAYVSEIERFCLSGGGYLDPDTHAAEASWEAALRAGGAGEEAVRALASGVADVGFVVMRPPGHHAMRGRAMGFCLFNNIAITARSLEAAGARVAIVDWDVHHGNGTQATFYDDPQVLYVSIHESPFYPGTGYIEEVGNGAATGTTVNLPFRPATGGRPYRTAMESLIRDTIEDFAADWLLVSAGYDAHRADPLAGMLLEAEDYGAMANLLQGVVPVSRTIFFLEGGYDLDAMRVSVAATLQGTRGDSFAETAPQESDEYAEAVIAKVAAGLGR
jgi:acetoin utilization deacetylase AcuC-like enzyme